ncbi:MAG TPA: hypothetical protein VJZ71_04305 [Phycisphaerae bacterium]|nr:hypothetical protein [Phycisphaerae bacterium]
MQATFTFFIVSALTVIPPGFGPTSQPASQPATRPAGRPEIVRLVAELGSPDFKARESAHRQLAAMGDAVSVELIEYIADPDEEIASRVVALLGKPKDPALRVEVAVRLLSTADPDWMERGVHLLFESPAEIIERFFDRTKDARGVERVIFDIVGERLRSWKKMDDIFQANYARAKEKNPEAAERLLQSNRESNLYDAEAAYWSAVEAVEDYRDPQGGEGGASSRPTSQSGN